MLGPNAEYVRVSDAWALKVGAIEDAEQAKKDAVAAERARITEAALKGELVESHVADIEAKHDKAIAGLRDEERAFAQAVDRGNELAQAIEANAEEWAKEFPPLEAAAKDRLRDALVIVRQSIAEMSAARGSVKWLGEFNAVKAAGGDVRNCAGLPVLVDHSALSRNDNPTRADRLLDLLEQIVR